MRAARLISMIMIFSAIGVSAKDAVKTGDGAAVISLSEKEWNFGSIPEGKQLRHVVVIINKGSKVLEIDSLIEGCSCLSASIDSEKIAPGKSARMTVDYDSAGSSGDIVRTVQILSNDPKNSVIEYTVKGNIQ
jgi:hypothetical protein